MRIKRSQNRVVGICNHVPELGIGIGIGVEVEIGIDEKKTKYQ